MFYLVCYDISENKIRRHIVKVLKGYGVRTQKSVFECAHLTERQFLEMKQAVEEHIDELTDSVRYYAICRGCLRNVEYSGLGIEPQEEKVKIV
ncbi:MAG: CRISPR-associated endonuclease Cas2 [Desulfobacterales bacterium]